MVPLELAVDVVVPIPTDQAFVLFTGGLARWWPREFTWSGPDRLADIGLPVVVGQPLWEAGALGLRWDWGIVLASSPGERLSFSWQIGPDRVPVPHPEDATRVDVLFAPSGEGSAIAVHHRGFEVHGEAGPAYRDQMHRAWPHALQAYAEAAGH